MVLKEDDFHELKLRVDKVSSELDKQSALKAVNTKWMITVGALILAALGYTSFIQIPKEAIKAAEKQVGEDTIREAEKIIARLRVTQKEAENIRHQFDKMQEITIPQATLAFFDSKECPQGWEPFKKGSGRFLLATADKYPHGKDGGFEKVPLKVAEMPEHSHENPTYGRGGTRNKGPHYVLEVTGQKGNYGPNHRRPTNKVGGNLPHQNMPPFLALTLCKKQ